MTFFSAVPLLGGIFNLVLSIFVYASERRSRLNQVFFAWALSIAIWNFGTFALFQKQDPEVAAMMIWSTIHGYTALFVRKRMSMFSDERRAELMQKAFSLFCETLRKSL